MSRAEAAKIEAVAAVDGARLKAEALKIETEAELERMTAAREADIRFTEDQNKLEIEKTQVQSDKKIYSLNKDIL